MCFWNLSKSCVLKWPRNGKKNSKLIILFKVISITTICLFYKKKKRGKSISSFFFIIIIATTEKMFEKYFLSFSRISFKIANTLITWLHASTTQVLHYTYSIVYTSLMYEKNIFNYYEEYNKFKVFLCTK